MFNRYGAALGAAVAIAFLAGAAHAKPWAKWAPAPLASDSAYVAFSARVVDSLGADEFAWLEIQRDWRGQRDQETRPTRAMTESWHPHHERPSDSSFAALASRPYTALADSERAWLIAESAAQHADRTLPANTGPSGPAFVGIILIAALVGAIVAAAAIAYAFAHAFDHMP